MYKLLLVSIKSSLHSWISLLLLHPHQPRSNLKISKSLNQLASIYLPSSTFRTHNTMGYMIPTENTPVPIDDCARDQIMTKWNEGLNILAIVYDLRDQYIISPFKVIHVLSSKDVHYGSTRGQTRTEGFSREVKDELRAIPNLVVGRIVSDWLKEQMDVDLIHFALMSENNVFVSRDLVRLVLKQNGVVT